MITSTLANRQTSFLANRNLCKAPTETHNLTTTRRTITTMETNEERVEALCTIIIRTDPEDWVVRNKALLHISELVSKCTPEHPRIAFTSNIFRALNEAIKAMVIYFLVLLISVVVDIGSAY